MKEFHGKTAVVTGAASGIGRALAVRCGQEGMNVVLADVEAGALAEAELALREAGVETLAVRVDVSRAGEVQALADQALARFGGVHLLFNNAGVAAGTTPWESTLADWEWVLGVNLWGVIHGLRAFVPVMLAQETEGHIVNTASVAGLAAYHPTAPYQVTKHAVVALSENLYYALAERRAKVKVSVLCPGWVNTRIVDAGRNRPPELQNAPRAEPPGPELLAAIREMRRAAREGMAPEQAADLAFAAIREERFYILTHPEMTPLVRQRLEAILAGQEPAGG